MDGLRAIAVLSVVLYHLRPGLLPGGFSGVDIFFVISGFIVSASVGSLDKKGLLSFISFFYARRLQRIAPALIVLLLAIGLATSVLIPYAWLSQTNQQTGLYAFFGMSNFILASTSNNYFSPITEYNPYTHTWSLGVEEQFYLIFPLLFFAWTFRGKWRQVTIVLLAITFISSLVYSAWLGHVDKTYAFYMITSRFWQLAAGVLLFQAMTFAGRRFDIAEQPSPKWFNAGGYASLLLIGYGFAASKPDTFPFPGSIPSVLGAVGLLGFLHGKSRDSWLVRILTNRPMLFVGKISYSLYLWHWPVFVLFRWTVGLHGHHFQLLALLIAFALATASYYWVETPLRRLSVLRKAPRLAVVVAGFAMVGAAAWLGIQINLAQPKISLSTVTRNSVDWYPYGENSDPAYPNCAINIVRTSVGPGVTLAYSRENCPASSSAPRIFAIGDSHAMAYEAMFKGYTLSTGAPVLLYNNGGCSFLSLQPWREDNDNCRLNTKAALDDMLAKIQPGDVVFLPSLRMPRFVDQWIRFPDAMAKDQVFGDWAIQGRAKAESEGEVVLRELHAKGARIILEGPNIVFRAPPFRCAESYNRTNPICHDGTSINRMEMEQLRAPVLASLEQLSRSVPNVSIWDPFPLLCPPADQCSAFLNGKPLFFDGDHVSGYGDRLLLPSFRSFVIGTGYQSAIDGTPSQTTKAQ